MKQREQVEQGASSKAPLKVRKPYVRPAARHEQVFETRALHCGKSQPISYACSHGRKDS